MRQPSPLAARRLATFGRRFDAALLTAARIRAGYTEQQLSRIVYAGAHRNRSSIANLEGGVSLPSIRTLMLICETLKCRVDDIAPKIDRPNTVNPVDEAAAEESQVRRAAYFQPGRD